MYSVCKACYFQVLSGVAQVQTLLVGGSSPTRMIKSSSHRHPDLCGKLYDHPVYKARATYILVWEDDNLS